MFVILLSYVRPDDEVDRVREAHREHLRREFDAGRFLLSGRRVPRTGGVIVARASSIDEVRAAAERDPYVVNGVATYELVEFSPGMWADELAELVGS